jgi:histidyl-tRNA synthetase
MNKNSVLQVTILELMNARGTRDYAPEEKIVRQKLIDDLRKVFELYGFSPLDTPIIERMEVLSAKFAAGETSDIAKEIFRLKDQGGRDLGLRFDLTVPFSRFVGMNPTVKMPFKRYQIGRVFRDGPIKAGRMREFWQCDVDVVGSSSMLADAQCVQIALRVFKELGLDVDVEVNNRKILNGIMRQVGLDEKNMKPAIIEIDKLKKVGQDEVKKSLEALGMSGDAITKALGMFSVSGTNQEKLDTLKSFMTDKEGIEGLKEVEEILSYTNSEDVVFNVSLARGLGYYTGPVFEVFLKDTKKFSSSLAGGGRFDRMIGDFLGSKKEYPAVGISFGIEPITAVLNSLTEMKTVTKLYIIPIGTMKESIAIAEQFRKEGINTDIDIVGKGVSKNLNYANALNIPFVAFIGEDEVKNSQIKLKDMNSGEESSLSVDDAIKKIQ